MTLASKFLLPQPLSFFTCHWSSSSSSGWSRRTCSTTFWRLGWCAPIPRQFLRLGTRVTRAFPPAHHGLHKRRRRDETSDSEDEDDSPPKKKSKKKRDDSEEENSKRKSKESKKKVKKEETSEDESESEDE